MGIDRIVMVGQADCKDRVHAHILVGAGVPAKQATRWMAPALPVFAGMPAPTEVAPASGS
ncbi:hypothetical protein E8E78_06425 [Pseudomonas sp. BN505]|nr:hypothetical protein [Pseudomonas sp. BN605]MDH4856237.1 hypothetical protein [Pseudomonas sp. BN505]ORL49323.1 hypothetical protein B7H18_22500 [Pseudomonas putida]